MARYKIKKGLTLDQALEELNEWIMKEPFGPMPEELTAFKCIYRRILKGKDL